MLGPDHLPDAIQVDELWESEPVVHIDDEHPQLREGPMRPHGQQGR